MSSIVNTNIESAKLRVASPAPRWLPAPFTLRLTVSERKFLLAIMDLALLNGSLLVVTMLWQDFQPVAEFLLAYAKWFTTLSALWWGVSIIFDIYDLALSASTTNILRNAGLATLLTTGVYLLIPWLTPPLMTRSYAFVFVALSVTLILTWRVIYAQTLYRTAFRTRALVVGTDAMARKLLDELNSANQSGDANPFRGTGYEVLGLVAVDDTPPAWSESNEMILGNANQLVRLVRNYHIDEVIVAIDDQSAMDHKVFTVLLDCCELGVKLRPVVEVYERLTARLPVEYARGYVQALWDRMDEPSARFYLAVRGLMDVLFALAGLALLGLLTPLVALGNAIWSPGPLFYRQVRLGNGGKPFLLSKFRSMVVDAEAVSGAMWSIDNDPRITPMGRWLRKSRLDELPQVINVLRGEMSMIGPRPERPHFAGKLSHDLPLYRVRNAMKPGLTGWAQIRYQYGNSVEDSRIKLEYDLYYIKHAGLYLDLLITLQTLSVIFRMKGK
jgi:exopolysaccharide biosynthesis polyprenyl glycosylphosphotransferase